ncbi:hypothetical protein EEL32_17865 [Brevibacillus laterosporus]|uniref:Uncharacterized protein n=1 Tax=Brevibacillus laterosporus TaxID=1465 RepID=A0A502IE60_BRELA|nr:hypothetical protein EEL30_05565 [Brevibacillus laterosporus]TPG71606.1 hypothetical protein EEL31_18215 [Brevibacillus laterosporus]TPG83668.1 hypothetical protein EEL32_17865 [Brevibacillus laterosporus]
MKKLVGMSLVAALSIGVTIPWTITNVQANDLPASLSDSSITPDKIEYIISEKGQTVPVIYIDDPEKAQEFMEQNGFIKESVVKEQNTNNDEKGKGIQPTAWLDYQLMDYVGTTKYDYRVDYTENRTKENFKWVREVSREATSETSITVDGGFQDAFKAEVGQKWKEVETFKDTFTVNIPAGKQGEIWTWNNAKVYKFKKAGFVFDDIFTATLATKDFGNSIVVTKFRNPHGEIPR